jgi:hypothetical protein
VRRRDGLDLAVPAARERVDDDHRAARVVADPVRHVAEQELLAPGHARVPDDEHVDPLVLGRADDRHRGVVVDHDDGVAAVGGDLRHVGSELVLRGVGPRALGGAVLGHRGVRRDHDLHDVQVGAEPLGEGRRPPDGALGGLRSVGTDHHAAHVSEDLGAHGRDIIAEARRVDDATLLERMSRA